MARELPFELGRGGTHQLWREINITETTYESLSLRVGEDLKLSDTVGGVRDAVAETIFREKVKM